MGPQKDFIKYEYDGKKSYEYSKFKGKKFLISYFKSRETALELLKNYTPLNEEQTDETLLKFYEINKSADNLNGCAILAINFALIFKKSKDIRYLNALLKTNDTLCSQIGLIKSALLKKMIRTSIIIELEGVKNIIKNKGIKIG